MIFSSVLLLLNAARIPTEVAGLHATRALKHSDPLVKPVKSLEDYAKDFTFNKIKFQIALALGFPEIIRSLVDKGYIPTSDDLVFALKLSKKKGLVQGSHQELVQIIEYLKDVLGSHNDLTAAIINGDENQVKNMVGLGFRVQSIIDHLELAKRLENPNQDIIKYLEGELKSREQLRKEVLMEFQKEFPDLNKVKNFIENSKIPIGSRN